jgi:hypothetical protein
MLTIREKILAYALPPTGNGLPCPERRLHVRGEPEGYLAWHEWARRKNKTHRSTRCPGCGLYKVWKPR